MKRKLFIVLALLLCATLVAAQRPTWPSTTSVLRQTVPTYTPSPTPTLTAIPWSTATPTATSPPPTSTPTPSGVYVLPNHSYYTKHDHLRIIGEVQNGTSYHLRFVSVAVSIFNSAGQLLDTDYTYTYLDNLAPGEKTCFKIWLDEPSNWSYYRFESPDYWTDGDPRPHLTLFNVTGSYDPTYDDYKILGQVRNDYGSEVRFVSPVGTLYNTAGTVIDCDYTYPNTYHLGPGQTSSFKMWFSSRGYADVTSYRLQVDGDPQ